MGRTTQIRNFQINYYGVIGGGISGGVICGLIGRKTKYKNKNRTRK